MSAVQPLVVTHLDRAQSCAAEAEAATAVSTDLGEIKEALSTFLRNVTISARAAEENVSFFENVGSFSDGS